jgi:hypothetical protein
MLGYVPRHQERAHEATRLHHARQQRCGRAEHEAYTAVAWGVRLSHERLDIVGAEDFHSPEGNMCGTAMRGAEALPARAKGRIGTWDLSHLADLFGDPRI